MSTPPVATGRRKLTAAELWSVVRSGKLPPSLVHMLLNAKPGDKFTINMPRK